jgi:hypothetical protein
MARTFLLICILALLSTGKAMSQVKDTIYMYKGQILIGNVQSISLGVLTIDETDLKLLHIKLYKIRRLRIYHRFRVETVDKRIFHARFDVSDKNGWIVIQPVDILSDKDLSFSVPIPIVDLYEVNSLEKNFFKRVHGSLSAGLSYSKSSNIGQVNLSTTINFATKHIDWQIQASELGSIDSSKYSRDNENLQIFTAYDLAKGWFISGILQYQRNLELAIARRYQEMIGGGNKLVVTDDLQLLLITGISFSEEKSTAGQLSGVLLEVPVMVRFNFYKFQHPNLQISTTPTAYFSITDKGRTRIDGNTSIDWEIIRYFNLTLTPYSSYDSKPPSGGGGKFNYGIVFGISYKF